MKYNPKTDKIKFSDNLELDNGFLELSYDDDCIYIKVLKLPLFSEINKLDNPYLSKLIEKEVITELNYLQHLCLCLEKEIIRTRYNNYGTYYSKTKFSKGGKFFLGNHSTIIINPQIGYYTWDKIDGLNKTASHLTTKSNCFDIYSYVRGAFRINVTLSSISEYFDYSNTFCTRTGIYSNIAKIYVDSIV